MSTPAPDKPKFTPAYCSFKSFNSFFDDRREDGHVTDVVDRSLMTNFAGSTAGELLSALKYLGMISEKGAPSDRYRSYVLADNEARVPMLAEAMRESYSYLFNTEGFNIERATSQQVAELFRAQNISGSTLARAIIFFLAAAKQANIKVSPNIRAPGVSSTSAKKVRKETTPLPPSAPLPPTPPPHAAKPASDVHVFEIPIPIDRKVSISIPKDFVDADWELFQTMLGAYIGHWKKRTAELQKVVNSPEEDSEL